MPTGYTAKLMENGQTFQEFVLMCARAFGATIDMRDDPLDKPIPDEFKPHDYNLIAGENARNHLETLRRMSNDEKIAYGAEMRSQAIRGAEEYLARSKAQNNRLLDMKAKVMEWTPPTTEHTELQTFMLQQIEVSLNDCSYSEEMLAKKAADSPMDYYVAAVERAERDIEYHRKAYAEEVERTNGRNGWIKALRESL